MVPVRFISSSSWAWVASNDVIWAWVSLYSSVTSWVVAFSERTSTARLRTPDIVASYWSGGTLRRTTTVGTPASAFVSTPAT